jgi:REP element-mobilizing transposase RayT
MELELLRGSHSVGEANYHIQLTPAYRQDVFADETVRVLTRDYMLAAADMHGITIAAIGFGKDHCHVFVVGCKNHSVAQLVKILKEFSSRMIRKHHAHLFADKLWGRKFWSAGYFYRTVGVVNARIISRYVEESQSKHWSPAKALKQAKLLEFVVN